MKLHRGADEIKMKFKIESGHGTIKWGGRRGVVPLCYSSSAPQNFVSLYKHTVMSITFLTE